MRLWKTAQEIHDEARALGHIGVEHQHYVYIRDVPLSEEAFDNLLATATLKDLPPEPPEASQHPTTSFPTELL